MYNIIHYLTFRCVSHCLHWMDKANGIGGRGYLRAELAMGTGNEEESFY